MSPPPLPVERLLQDWRGAVARIVAYLRRLGADEPAREALAHEAIARVLARESGEGAPLGPGLDAASEILLESRPPPRGPGARDEAFERWRLAAWWSGGLAALGVSGRDTCAGPPLPAPGLLPATPPLARGSMVPERVGGRLPGQTRRRRGPRGVSREAEAVRRREAPERKRWARAARRRHILLPLLVLIPSVIAAGFMLELLPYRGRSGLEVAIALFFGALLGWISIGFWTAVFGFGVLLKGDRFAIAPPDDAPPAPIDPAVRTAIVMPIYEESVSRVFAGLRATRESLVRAGGSEHFDFFMLSDSVRPSTTTAEEIAFAEWRRAAGPAAGVYYRRRRIRQKRKSGNVADFCRRWGRSYRYMIVLDADSVMSGEALVRLVGLMERNPRVGAIQTVPAVVRARTLFARIQQFGSRLYGSLFAAGMHFLQLGESPYWGHNAIIRVEAFMAHCGLPRLSGKPPFGGDIMSHDFVEAALLGRAGWSIWLAYQLPGSWEEGPDSLLEEMQRDRRWCQGNLQHLRLLLTEGIYAAHRVLFLNGIFAYVSALLWLIFLVLISAKAIVDALSTPDYFPSGPSLFPEWPVWRPGWALAIFAFTLLLLFLPKILAALLVLRDKRSAAGFGGRPALLASLVLEILASALFAPIRMVFHCKFVILSLAGSAVGWTTDSGASETTWREALRRHGPDTAVAAAWGAAIYLISPERFWWLMPVAGALILSVPVSVWASREGLAKRFRRARLFVTPEELRPPVELASVAERMQPSGRGQQGDIATEPWKDGFVRAVVDPYANAVHCSLLRGPRRRRPDLDATRDALVARALAEGPGALGLRERRLLLSDPERLRRLHEAVWRLDAREAAYRWSVAPLRAGDLRG